mgnify:CR=1 FL=1
MQRAARGLAHLHEGLDELYINGSMEHRLPHNLNISFAYVEGEGLMMGIKDVAVSSGSACTSASLEPSYVLRALGVGRRHAERAGGAADTDRLGQRASLGQGDGAGAEEGVTGGGRVHRLD